MKDEINTIATISPEKDKAPKGDVRVVANIGGEESVGQKPQIISTKEFRALVIVQIDNVDSYPDEKNNFFKKLTEQIYGALKGFSYAGYKVVSANVRTDADMFSHID